ncbi:unnamed protein product [Oikopleura dioica]|uniref:Solute carrier family 35 member B1 n=1 Tax=Oikopleura dioica TaxID=34765 RepID=E4WTQ9_OIKDI|nr:unnamed protein product [Oikopleura dioica]CBY30526.1 unnamed protein product [Oikopleura dioica]
MERKRVLLGTACFFGIVGFYLAFGIAQESVTKVPFSGENWKFMLTLTWLTCCINALITNIILSCCKRKCHTIKASKNYLATSISNAAAILCTNKSLQYVSYPAQVLGKSCRPIPVIVFSAIIARKFHSIWKWISVVLITAGISLFIYDEDSNIEKDEQKIVYFGDLLLAISLVFDGVTSAFQEKIRNDLKDEPKTNLSSIELMNTLNTWAALISFPFTFINLEIILAFKFMAAHHDVIWKIAVMSGCSCLGQMFIFLCVVEL